MNEEAKPSSATLNTRRRMARLAYDGYAKFTGGKTFDGRAMPTWDDLTPRIQEAWMAAMMAGTTEARAALEEGLAYHEHDGHDMPKRVARTALEILGVDRKDQP